MVSKGRREGRVGVPLLTLIAFSSASLVPTGVSLGLGIYLPRYFSRDGALTLAAVGAAFSIVRLIDIALDPALGVLMDHSRTPIGRYRPWMLAGAPILMGAIYMLFMAPKGAGQVYLVGWLLVFYAGTSILYLSQSAWGGQLSGSYVERARIFGAIQVLGLLGSVTVLLAPVVFKSGARSEEGLMHVMGWTMIAILPVLVMLATLITPEPKISDQHAQKATLRDYVSILARPTMMRLVLSDLAMAFGPGSMAAIYLFFWHDARGYALAEANIFLIAHMICGIFGAPFWAWLGGRIGKHVAMVISAMAFAGANIIIAQIPKGHFWLVLFVASCIGAFVAGFTLLVRAMVADAADEVRLEHGRERSGVLYALVTSTQKIGGALSVGITFSLLSMLGYNPATQNTPEHMQGLAFVYTWVPVFFVLVGCAFFWRYPLTSKRHAEIRAALEARNGGVTPDAPFAAFEPSASVLETQL